MATPQNPNLNEHGQPVGISVSSVPAKAPNNTQPLQGRVISLIALLPSHSTSLYPLISGAENTGLWTYMPDTPCVTATDFHAQTEAKSRSTDPLFYTIWCASPNSTLSKHDENAKPVGYLSLLNIDLINRKVEIGHVMFSKFLQQSIASTEAVFLLMKYSFETLGMRRVEWKCNSLNAPSSRAAKRLGFRYEGEFKNHYSRPSFTNGHEGKLSFSLVSGSVATLQSYDYVLPLFTYPLKFLRQSCLFVPLSTIPSNIPVDSAWNDFFNYLLANPLVIIKGKNRDSSWFSVTEEEWKLVKGGLEMWLGEDNFEGGVQLSKLENCRAKFAAGS